MGATPSYEPYLTTFNPTSIEFISDINTIINFNHNTSETKYKKFEHITEVFYFKRLTWFYPGVCKLLYNVRGC